MSAAKTWWNSLTKEEKLVYANLYCPTIKRFPNSTVEMIWEREGKPLTNRLYAGYEGGLPVRLHVYNNSNDLMATAFKRGRLVVKAYTHGMVVFTSFVEAARALLPDASAKEMKVAENMDSWYK